MLKATYVGCNTIRGDEGLQNEGAKRESNRGHSRARQGLIVKGGGRGGKTMNTDPCMSRVNQLGRGRVQFTV